MKKTIKMYMECLFATTKIPAFQKVDVNKKKKKKNKD